VGKRKLVAVAAAEFGNAANAVPLHETVENFRLEGRQLAIRA
jgi:hypothetical protein